MRGALPPDRILALDVIRGVAVMGILAMNIVAFALPEGAYFDPRSIGMDSLSDRISWFASFSLVDGKMRGLFTVLFGASMLLVIERADAAGQPSSSIHFSRMAWLLLIGLAHFYLIWWGDILSLYAIVGMAAWFFAYRTPSALLGYGAALILLQWLIDYAQIGIARFDTDPETIESYVDFYRGGFWSIASFRLHDDLFRPLLNLLLFGWETLGYMLLGMAGLKTGFLTGAWQRRSYITVAAICLGLCIPIYALLAWAQVRAGFSDSAVQTFNLAATTPIRPLFVAGIAALIILLSRSAGPLTERTAAAGRVAFTNYLGTSLLMTFLFYGWGLGLFAKLSRAELWLVVLPAWGLMLLWSEPWLKRFRHGPLEWLWRSLARGAPQPMLR